MRTNRAIGILLALSGILLPAVAAQKTAKQFLNPAGLSKPTGYTHVVTSPPGRMVFISGQTGFSPDGQLPTDFETQARNTFANIGRCLQAGGAKFEDIVKINYYLSDLANTAALRRIRAQYLNPSAPPASTLVQVGLMGKGVLLEVEVVAIVPD